MTETNFTSDTLKEIKVRNIYDKSLINFRFPSSAKVSARTSQRRTKSTLERGCSVQAARETAAARYKGFMNGCKDFTWNDFHSLNLKTEFNDLLVKLLRATAEEPCQ